MLTVTPKSSAEVEIERLSLNHHTEPQYDLSLLSTDRRVQVRDTEHYAPKAQVSQYAIQMGEVQFPPIIVSRNNWLVDGNTREEAKKMRKEKFTPAIVIDADYGKDPKTDAKFHALAATMNQTGGQRLTPVEAKNVTRTLVEQGWKTDQIGRAVGVKPSQVSNVRREVAAEEKFAKVGFKDMKKLGGPLTRAFGDANITSLNDIPYKNLAELARDANLNVTEVREHATEMKKTGSDAGMITYIDAKRAEMEERIKEHALIGNGKPPASSQLRRHLGFVNAHASNPNALVERSVAAMADHLKAVEDAIAVLQAVSVLQEAAIND
jgi:hypothetical protein